MKVRDERKLSRPEILGAWLGVWTPPRDAEIPPVPWRKVAVGMALLAVAGVLVAVLVAPAIDESKGERAAEERRELAERRAARQARQRAEQRPRTGRLAAGRSRPEALRDVEVAIGRDARARFHPRSAAATCAPAPGFDEGADKVLYNCLSSIRRIIAGGEQGAVGDLGTPYNAVLDFAGRAYAFCKVNPIPGEQIVPDPRQVVLLPAECQLRRP